MRVSDLNVVKSVPRAKGQLREAMQYVRERPALWMTMVLIFFVATFGMNFQVTNALMSRQVFHTGAGLFGLASAVLAVGSLAGALLAARRARPTMTLLMGTAGAFSVFEVVAGLMPNFWSYLIMLVPTGLALLTFSTAANSATQLGTTAEMRGRVMGLYMLVFLGGAPIGSPLVGWAAEAFGPRVSLLAGGVISGVATAVVGLMLARSRGKRGRAVVPPPDVLDELEAAVAPLRPGWPALRWTGMPAWHLTLAFLGEVGDDTAAALGPRLERAA